MQSLVWLHFLFCFYISIIYVPNWLLKLSVLIIVMTDMISGSPVPFGEHTMFRSVLVSCTMNLFPSLILPKIMLSIICSDAFLTVSMISSSDMYPLASLPCLVCLCDEWNVLSITISIGMFLWN